MRIKCKSSGKFLANIEVETFYDVVCKLLNTTIEVPLSVEFYCKACKRTEFYEIYKDHYIRKSEKKEN